MFSERERDMDHVLVGEFANRLQVDEACKPARQAGNMFGFVHLKSYVDFDISLLQLLSPFG